MLNEEQKKLVEENHNLIYKVILDHGLDKETYYGAGAIGLCCAAKVYDEKLGFKFSSLAYKCILNKINRERVLQSRQVGEPILDSEIISDDLNIYLIDDSNKEDVDQLLDIERALSKLDKRTRKIMLMKYEGYSLKDIGREMGISGERVRQVLKRGQEKCQEELLCDGNKKKGKRSQKKQKRETS